MFQIHMTWLEQQPCSELQSKTEVADEGSDGSSSCGSIESPPVRSRLLQIARSEDLDGPSSARHWREDERRLASTERRRRSMSGQKSRFCAPSERPFSYTEDHPMARPVEGRCEQGSNVSLLSTPTHLRTKED